MTAPFPECKMLQIDGSIWCDIICKPEGYYADVFSHVLDHDDGNVKLAKIGTSDPMPSRGDALVQAKAIGRNWINQNV